MIYNIKENKVINKKMCATCPYRNAHTKLCNGTGIVCFEMDSTGSLIDEKTKMVIKKERIEQLKQAIERTDK